MAPAGDRVYVTQQGTVAVIDSVTNSLAATIELGVGAEPDRIAFTADGTAAYVTDAGADTVSVIDTTTNTVTGHIELGNCPHGGCNPSDIAIASPRAYCGGCLGDCNGDGSVGLDELIRGISIALGVAALAPCPVFDPNADHRVSIDELLAALNMALGDTCVTVAADKPLLTE